MTSKIDPSLFDEIKTLALNNKPIECLVYANRFSNTKNYFKNIMDLDIEAEFPFINAFALKLEANQISDLAKWANINYITSNLKVQTQIDIAKQVINASSIKTKSNNFACVVIDTGVAPTIDMCVPENKIISFVDFINNKATPYDDNGHGTSVASVLCGNGLVSGSKYAGVNPNCKIIAIKALDKNGETGAINILKAMQWVLDNKKTYNIKLVCMSFGSTVLTKNDPLIVGAETLWDNGICVVAAAGNSGPESQTIKSPGASSKIITVGALNDFRQLDLNSFGVADFSSRGPILNNYKPDVLAPGVDIVCGCNFNLNKKHYMPMSGTSIATPIVAGACSHIIAQNINILPNEIKRRLINSATKLNLDRNQCGFGLLNCKNL